MKFIPEEPQELIKEHLLSSKDALLFVGMGIGKSAACLDTLNELFNTGSAFAALIVAPLRVANLTWPMQFEEWDEFKWMKVANLRTESGQRAFLNSRAHIYTINYEALGALASLAERRKYKLPYDVVIFDELTRAKNPGSKRINFYRRKVPRVERQWGLTGTPMPNSWQDLFAQVRLVDGGERLGNNFLEFKRTYFFAPEQETFVATPAQKKEEWRPKSTTVQALERKISDITITLKSSDWLDIPDTHYEDVEITFSPELRKRYTTLEQKLVMELGKGKTLNVANAAALVTKLLQFTSGHIYDEERGVHAVHTLKFEAIKRIAREEESPLLVAYMFEHEKHELKRLFPHIRFFADCRNSNEEKTIAAEKQLVNEWNAGKIRMLAGHPNSLSHGLNLQYGCNALLWISLTYSRESYEQFIGRVARRGQDKVTKVYRLIVPGTVDDAVAEAIAEKAENEKRLISALMMLESYRNQKAA